jgi:hypothetical protein
VSPPRYRRLVGRGERLVGTLEVSRALADRQLADEVLEQGIQTALALLGNDPS